MNYDNPSLPVDDQAIAGTDKMYVSANSTDQIFTIDFLKSYFINGLATSAALDLKADLRPTVNAQTGTTYTVQASDAGKVVTLTNAAAITVTCSGLADGSVVTFEQLGAGQVTFVNGSLTVRHVASLTKTAGIYARVFARVSGSNLIFCGDMS